MKQFYIYKITNLIDNKVYVGQHLSNKDMMVGDKYMGSGLHIKRAIEKYGVENFRRDILACTSTRENSDILEKYYIGLAREKYDCYNIADGGQGGDLGINNKKVLCVELNKAFESMIEAAKDVGLKDSSGISMVLWGKCKTAGGYHWAWVDEENPYLREQMKFDGDIRKKVLCVETNKIYDSTAAAAKDVGLKSSSSISEVLHGKRKTAGGYHWAWVDDENPYLEEQMKPKKYRSKKVKCVELNKAFESMTEAARAMGFKSTGSIRGVLHGRRKTAGGYHWEYID